MQNDGKHIVCHICLKSRECTYEYVETVTIEILRFLGLGQNLDVSGRPVTCKICSDNLQKCFDFKTACVYTEDCISSFKDDRNNINLDLWEIYLRKTENKDIVLSKSHTVCRLCMEIAEAGCYTPLNDDSKDVTSAKTILERYISEIDLDNTKNPVISISCNESLYSYFNFVQSCLNMENTIKKECEIEETENKPQEESNSMLQFGAENILNYEKSYADIDMPKNCDENELRDEIKLEFGNMSQRESTQLHIKREVNECEDDGVEVEKLDIFEKKYQKNREYCETELKFEEFVESKYDGTVTKHEEIDIKTDEEDIVRFQKNMVHKNDSEVTVYSCQLCTQKQYKHKSSLKNHMLKHKNSSEVTTYSCELCTYTSKYKGSLKKHMLIHKGTAEVTMYSCEMCAYKSKYSYNLKKHTLIHENATPSKVTIYPCEVCTHKATQKGNLKTHMLTHHSGSEVTLYSCEMCTYKSKRKSCLQQHMLIHKSTSEVTMYSCEICTFKSKHKSSLNKHMLIHKNTSEVTMYSCDQCTYKVKLKSNLKTHMFIHKNASEATLYFCEMCTYKSKLKSSLRRHMLIHKSTSEVKMYSCDICPHKSKQKSDLKQHMLIHKTAAEVTMYFCEICRYKSKRKSNLKQHMLIHRNTV